MSKSHPDQWTVEHDVQRVPNDLVRRLAGFPTTQIADCGGPVGVVAPGLVPQAGGADLCGTAVTVWTKPGDILFILAAADVCTPGDVVVVDGGGRTDAAVVGDIFTSCVAAAGGTGIVVDGAVRDLDGIDEVGIPVFARAAHPATGSNEGPGAINVAVQVGGVPVHPGDVVRADRSGIVVIPARHVEEVLALTEEVARREEAWRAQLARGTSLATATGVLALIAERGRGAGQVALP